MPVEIHWDGLSKFTSITGQVLSGDGAGAAAYNTFDNPHQVEPKPLTNITGWYQQLYFPLARMQRCCLYAENLISRPKQKSAGDDFRALLLFSMPSNGYSLSSEFSVVS